MKRLLYLVLALFLLAGCGGGGGGGSESSVDEQVNPGGKDGTTEAVLESLEISPGDVSLPVGVSQELKVTGVYSDGPDRDLTQEAEWSVSEEDIVQLLSGTSGVTVKGLSGDSSTIITARIGEIADDILVTVTNAELKYIDIEPASAQIPVGLTKEFQAMGEFSDGTVLDITSEVSWRIEPEGIASIENGLVTGNTIGDTVLIAQFDEIKGEADLSVVELDPIDLAIVAETTDLPLGAKSQLKAEAEFADGSKYDFTQRVEWSSAPNGVASVSNEEGSRGVVSAEYIGSAKITATFENGVEAFLEMTVTEAALECIHVTPEAVFLSPGQYQSFKAFGVYSDGKEMDITPWADWVSSDEKVATPLLLTSGVVKANGAGEASITASYEGKEGKASVRVLDATGLRIVSDTEPLLAGQTIPFKALAKLSNGLEIDVTPWAEWSVEKDWVASFSSITDKAALLTAHEAGSTEVYAEWDGFKAVMSISVE